MPANIINSGTPLTPGSTAPLWTDLCDNSSNLVNVTEPTPLTVAVADRLVNGVTEVQFEVQAPDQIDSIEITGLVKGKLQDQISLTLKHPVYGVFPLLAQHALLGDLTSPYPLPGETREFNLGELIPPGFAFKNFVSGSTSTQIVLPDGASPADFLYYTFGTSAYQWQVKAVTPGGPTTQITVPAHRYPYTPDRNNENPPFSGLVSNGFNSFGVNNTTFSSGPIPLALVFRGFRYVMRPQVNNSAQVVQTLSLDNVVFDNGNSNTTQGYFSTGSNPYSEFITDTTQDSSGGGLVVPFGEELYTKYGAHEWYEIGVTRSAFNYLVQNGLSFFFATKVVDTHTIQFLKWPDIVWDVTPLGQVTWESIVPPTALYQYYPPDYNDTLALAERSEPIDLTMHAWDGQPAEGTWTLEITGASTAIAATGTSPGLNVVPAPTVTPGIIRIAGLSIQINLRTNQPYVSVPLTGTTPTAGTLVATTQANLRAVTDDRAMIAILCGINGSTMMGILCGYALQRVGQTGEVYNVTYFLARTCNINHVNLTRRIQAISFDAQDWANIATPAGAAQPTAPTAFSTKGSEGEGYIFHPTKHRIYPVRGQIGLKVTIQGTTLKFMLLGDYPVLTYQNPTVALVDNFQRYSLNA